MQVDIPKGIPKGQYFEGFYPEGSLFIHLPQSLGRYAENTSGYRSSEL